MRRCQDFFLLFCFPLWCPTGWAWSCCERFKMERQKICLVKFKNERNDFVFRRKKHLWEYHKIAVYILMEACHDRLRWRVSFHVMFARERTEVDNLCAIREFETFLVNPKRFSHSRSQKGFFDIGYCLGMFDVTCLCWMKKLSKR